MRQSVLAVVMVFFSVMPWPIRASDKTGGAANTVTRLADEFVTEYERRFPFAAAYSGVALKSQSGIDINSPQHLHRWRQFVRKVEGQLNAVRESDVADRPEWLTRAFLAQGIAQVRADEVCRSELWTVSPFGWVYQLPSIADAQPVGTPQERAEAIVRWESLPLTALSSKVNRWVEAQN